MGFLDNVTGNLSEFAGGISKGVLVVRKVDDLLAYLDKDGMPTKKKSSDRVSANDFAKKTEEAEKKVLKLAKDSLKAGNSRNKIASTGGKKIDQKAVQDIVGGGYAVMEVQYNPSSLSFSTMNGERMMFQHPGMGEVGGNMETKITIPSQTSLSFTLILEEINPANAFMHESEQLLGGASSIGNGVNTASSIMDKINGQGPRVRQRAEALLALMLTPVTREVMFIYSGTLFHGNLSSITVNYKMFDKQGEPVLAEAAIKISQSDKFVADKHRWEQLFSDYFDEHPYENQQEEQRQQEEADIGSLSELFD